MNTTRRRFLRIAGTAAVGAAAGTAAACGSAPAGGRRWAMVVDLQACRRLDGCRACIDACHRAHNVPEIPDSAHEVKWIWKERFENAFPSDPPDAAPAPLRASDVLVFCSHCDNPPCVRVCPTQATWRRDDGVVAMDEHRCIGCRYCVAACPYGSRSFNWSDPRPFIKERTAGFPTRTRGVVEKCNFCEERLAKGDAPHCVVACSEGALVFGDLNDPASAARRLLASRYAIRRRPELGTRPQAYYLI